MKRCLQELIALPNNADLDAVGALRCLTILFPEAAVLHPVRLRHNAWEALRKQIWFDSLRHDQIDFSQTKKVYLLGISQSRQNRELIEELVKHQCEVEVFSDRIPQLPIAFKLTRMNSLSLTASLFMRLHHEHLRYNDADIHLFDLAITEKTWSGLAAKMHRNDLQALEIVRQLDKSPFKLANQVVLGMRDGQAGLYRHMLKNVEDIESGFWPIAFIAVKSAGQVQELEPVLDAIWSDLGQPILVAMVSYNNFSRIWARSNISQVDFSQVFSEFKPFRCRSWHCFNFSGENHCHNRQTLLDCLSHNLIPDQTAGEIMSASPQCIDWNSTVKQAFDQMLKFNIMSLVVLKEGDFAGIVTRRDLDRALQMQLLDATIGPYVPTNFPVVSPQTPVRVLKSLMVRYNLTRLPVIDGNRVTGIITTHELLRALSDPLPLPQDFLPLAEPVQLPEPLVIESALKRVFSLKIFHLLSKIGKFATKVGVQAFAVGGFVRDLLLERQNFDIDVVIIGDAMKFAADLSNELDCEYKVFDRFHTARIYLEDLKVDFSSARIEHYANPGALPQIEYSGLSNDLYRRDFTINALALCINPENFLQLKDFFGGYQDLINRQIRILHAFSFLEDPTRLFRALRFAGRFKFVMESDTRQAFELAISREAPAKLSIKRIAAEISRGFNEERAQPVIAEVFAAGLMKYLSRELVDASILPTRFKLIKGLVKRFSGLHEEIDTEAIHWAGILSLLPADKSEDLLEAINTAHSQRVKILQAIRSMRTIPATLARVNADDNFNLYHELSKLDIETLIALIAFSLDKRNARKVIYFVTSLRHIQCSISGKDLIAEGIKPGPHMRVIFEHIINMKLSGKALSREEELQIAKELHQNL